MVKKKFVNVFILIQFVFGKRIIFGEDDGVFFEFGNEGEFFSSGVKDVK